MAKAAWYVGALAAVMAAVTGCGGGARRHKSTPPRTRPALLAPTGAIRLSPTAIKLPASSRGPTTCTVYEAGYATQVIFESPDLDVRAECREWTRYNPAEGYLWGYEPTSATEAVGSTRICYLVDPHADSTASVVQETAFRTVSGTERANASSACASLQASGWIAQLPAPPDRRH